MRIALLSRWLWEECRRMGPEGGTVLQLAQAVRDAGHEVVALSQSPEVRTGFGKTELGGIPCWLSPRDKRHPFAYVADKLGKWMTGHRKLLSDARALQRCLAEEERFDGLWCQCEEPDGLVAGVARRFGPLPPTFVHVFALRYRFLNGKPIYTHQAALGESFETARLVAANSPLVRGKLRGIYKVPDNKLTVLPHNLTRQFLDAAGSRGLDRPNLNRVLFLGALNEKKGALVFLKAAARIAKRRSEMRFVMAGAATAKDPGFDDLFEAAQTAAGLGDRLEFTGHLTPEALQEQVRLAGIVVLPSLFDEWSRALVEVLALGRPVVTTTTVGASYLVKRYLMGRVVPPNNDELLAQGILELRRELRGMAAMGEDESDAEAERIEAVAARLRREFSSEAIADQLIRLWESRLLT